MRGTGGIADSLEDGRAVQLVDIGNYRAMAAALDNVLQNPICKFTLQRVVKPFSIEIGWKRYLDVVTAAIEREKN